MIEFFEQLGKRWGMAEDREWLKMTGGKTMITLDDVENIIVEAGLDNVLQFERTVIDIDINELGELPQLESRFDDHAFSFKIIAMLILADREMRAEVNKQEIKDG